MRVEDAECRVERARAQTTTVREQAEKKEKNFAFGIWVERAKNDPEIKAQLEKAYPHVDLTPILSPDTDP